jgi:hypothetical protein
LPHLRDVCSSARRTILVVLEFLASVLVGVVVAFAWAALWAVALRSFGLPVLMRTPEECATRKQRILQLGKLRYVALFGVLGNGVAFGLAVAIAITLDTRMVTRGPFNVWRGAVIFGAMAVLGGCFHGLRSWYQLFRTEVLFPPAYPPMK